LDTGLKRSSVLLVVVFRSLVAGAMGSGTAPMQFSPSAFKTPILVHFDVGHMSNPDARPKKLVHRLGKIQCIAGSGLQEFGIWSHG
jgi:hypothetical protein